MKKLLAASIALITSVFAVNAIAAPGEYWEVTTKMDMPGMPMAMPATTQKVCVAKGGANDPRHTSKDKDCEMSDVKVSGNKSSWTVKCNRRGEEWTGKGEQTTSGDSYKGSMQMSGKSRSGRDMNMNMSYSGKRVGGSCDSEEMAKQAEAQGNQMKAQMCDTSQIRNTAEWINMSNLYLPKEAPCFAKKQQLCDQVRKDAPRDADAYSAMVQYDQRFKGQPHVVGVAQGCGLNMADTTKSICSTLNDKNFRTLAGYCPAEVKAECKTLNGKNYSLLSSYCPAEAKAYRVAERKRECQRSYTSQDDKNELQKCLKQAEKGDAGDASASASGGGSSGGQSAKNIEPKDTPAPAQPKIDPVAEGAKKLRGLLHF